MARALVVAVAVALATAASASAVEMRDPRDVQLVTPDGQVAQPYQRWASAARVPTVPDTFTVQLAPCPNHPEAHIQGCIDIAGGTIWLRPWSPRRVLLHELGHAFDAQVLGGDGLLGHTGERFAERYTDCAVMHRKRERHVCAAIRQAPTFGPTAAP